LAGAVEAEALIAAVDAAATATSAIAIDTRGRAHRGALPNDVMTNLLFGIFPAAPRSGCRGGRSVSRLTPC